MNVHTPERQAGESQEQYKARRAASARLIRSMRLVGASGGQSSREKQRDDKRKAGTLRGTYGLGLLQPQRKRDQQRMAKMHQLRDDSGAYTLAGARLSSHSNAAPLMGASLGTIPHNGRRIWLAGISAQRGY